jgi:hypothetical protein
MKYKIDLALFNISVYKVIIKWQVSQTANIILDITNLIIENKIYFYFTRSNYNCKSTDYLLYFI